MWCTRWFLPLLLLPLPTASPYFLFLFFFSLTLHARPCFYCIILLTALFTSSCYWQPVPTRTLIKATFPDVSDEAPLWFYPNASLSDEGIISSSQLRPMPSLTRLLDRCWCDLSGGHFFDPYNTTLWQLTSLSQTLRATRSEAVLIAQGKDVTSFAKGNLSDVGETPRITRAWVLKPTTEKNEERYDEDGDVKPSLKGSVAGWFRPAVSLLWRFRVSMPFPLNASRHNSSDSSSEAVKSSSGIKGSGAVATKTRLLRRKYDLRPHGIDLVVDFGWGRSSD